MAHRTFKTDNRRDCFFTPTELKVYQDNTMRIVYDTVPVSGTFQRSMVITVFPSGFIRLSR